MGCPLLLQVAVGVSDEVLLPTLPNNLPPSVAVLVIACLTYDPDMRPSFGTVVEELTKIIGEMREVSKGVGGGGGARGLGRCGEGEMGGEVRGTAAGGRGLAMWVGVVWCQGG